MKTGTVCSAVHALEVYIYSNNALKYRIASNMLPSQLVHCQDKVSSVYQFFSCCSLSLACLLAYSDPPAFGTVINFLSVN